MTLTAHRPTTSARPTAPQVSRHPAAPHAAPPLDGAGLALSHLVLVVLGLTLVGAALAGLQLLGAPTGAGSSSQPVLRTPYGLVAVGDVTVSAAVDASKGMVSRGTGGEGHAAHTGAASGAAQLRVNVPVTLQNDSDAAVRYAPGQFRLVTSDGQPVGPQDSPALTGQLRPDAAVALRLTFALPAGATGTRLVVDGGRPAAGLDLRLPAASTPGQPMTPQDQPAQPVEPPAEPAGPAKHSTSDTSHH